MTFYHHQTIKRYTSAMLSLFNDIHIVRTDENGVVERDSVVPIKFASTQKAYTLADEDYDQLRESNYNVLPRFSLGISGMTAGKERDTNKLNKIGKLDVSTDPNEKAIWSYNSVAYNIDFELSILAKTFTDLTIIIEQILPMFNPTYNMKFRDLDFHEEYRTVPIRLNGVDMDLDVDLDLDGDVRFVTATMSLTVEANLYPSIKESKLIHHVDAKLHARDARLDYTDDALIPQV